MQNSESAEVLSDQIKRRFSKCFLDILILQLVDTQPTWGYDMIKKTQMQYQVKLRHGALYPMLNELQMRGLVKSRRELQKGRARKVYQITRDGAELLQAYYDFARRFLPNKTVN